VRATDAAAGRPAGATDADAPASGAADAPIGRAKIDGRSLGILGGTFNPPHRGHLALARRARVELGLERVVLMPAHSAPHKGDGGDPGPERRLEMCRLAIGGEVGLEVCGLEIERGGPSYTVDTLRTINEIHPETELTFIVGADMALSLPSWREPEALVGLARLAVAEREHGVRGDVLKVLAPLRAEVAFLEMPRVAISSSLVRERVWDGEPIEGLVEPAVAEFIAEHELYRAPLAAATGMKAGAQ
jgi:nicotinate-nucleotide adenylyltransferase